MSEAQTETAHHVANISEIPLDPITLRLNQGHTRDFRDAGFISEKSLYYVLEEPGSDKYETHPFSSVSVEDLLSNPNIRENKLVRYPGNTEATKDRMMPAQDVLFGILYQELVQTDFLSDSKKFLDPNNVMPKKYVERKIKDYSRQIQDEYTTALAVQSALTQIKGPESADREKAKKAVDVFIMNEDGSSRTLDSRFEEAKAITDQIRKNYGI